MNDWMRGPVDLVARLIVQDALREQLLLLLEPGREHWMG